MFTSLVTTAIITKKGKEKIVTFPLERELYEATLTLPNKERKKYFADYYYEYIDQSKYERKTYWIGSLNDDENEVFTIIGMSLNPAEYAIKLEDHKRLKEALRQLTLR